jgi:hypothetical protein
LRQLSEWHVLKLPRFIQGKRNSKFDAQQFRQSRSQLLKFSIVNVDKMGDMTIHPLVKAWAMDRMCGPGQQVGQKQAWLTTASTLVLSARGNINEHAFWRKLQAHIESCMNADKCFLLDGSVNSRTVTHQE